MLVLGVQKLLMEHFSRTATAVCFPGSLRKTTRRNQDFKKTPWNQDDFHLDFRWQKLKAILSINHLEFFSGALPTSLVSGRTDLRFVTKHNIWIDGFQPSKVIGRCWAACNGQSQQDVTTCWKNQIEVGNLGGEFKVFYFSPRNLGKIPILTHIFHLQPWIEVVTPFTTARGPPCRKDFKKLSWSD